MNLSSVHLSSDLMLQPQEVKSFGKTNNIQYQTEKKKTE
jgi:hypothetical protein